MTSIDQPDLYATLGVDPHASSEQVTHAYCALVRRYHPDTRPSGPSVDGRDGTEDIRLRQVLAAYAVLHDPASRADYDRRRQPAPARPAPHPRPVSADPPVVIGTVTGRQRRSPAWIATIDSTATDPPSDPLWEWIRAAFDR